MPPAFCFLIAGIVANKYLPVAEGEVQIVAFEGLRCLF